MTLETVVAGLTGTHAEVLAQVKARMTTGVGRLPGAELGGVLLGCCVRFCYLNESVIWQ